MQATWKHGKTGYAHNGTREEGETNGGASTLAGRKTAVRIRVDERSDTTFATRFHRRLLIALLTLAVLGAVPWVTQSALSVVERSTGVLADANARQGLIAFTASKPRTDSGGGWFGGGFQDPVPTRIYVAQPDGSNRRSLTGASLMKGSLAWSPDGSMLAFTTFDVDRMSDRLSIMSATGSDRRVICKDCTGTFWTFPEDEICIDYCERAAPFRDRLAWSPNGRWLAAREPCRAACR